jgi:hypothetical protein
MGKVIRLNDTKDDLRETFDEILEYRDQLTEFAVVCRFKNETEEQRKKYGNDYRTMYKFFGANSTINIGGFVHHLYDLIAQYLVEATENIE